MSTVAFDSPEAAARELLRHIDPKEIEPKLFDAITLNRDTAEELLQTVDVPLKIGTDSEGNQFVLCDYNRDADSYRSPFTNTYIPSLPDGALPTERLRKMEEMANRGFQSYLRQYFDYGVLSVYCWEVDDESFGVGVFVRKDIDQGKHGTDVIDGSISCSDVCEVRRSEVGDTWEYSLVSSALVNITWKCKVGGPLQLNGDVNDQKFVTARADSDMDHLVTIGKMIEGNADRFVEKIRGIAVSKMKEILSYMKMDENSYAAQQARDMMTRGLVKH